MPDPVIAVSGIPEDDLIYVILLIRPGAIWTLRGLNLTWSDTVQPMPTNKELQDGYTQLQANRVSEAQSVSAAKTQLSDVVVNADPRVDALITLLQKKGVI